MATRRTRLTPDQKEMLSLTTAQLHCQGYSGADIVHELNERHHIKTNGMQVSRLLNEAKEMGIVRPMYFPPFLSQLGQRLVMKYRCLKEARVVAAGTEPEIQL